MLSSLFILKLISLGFYPLDHSKSANICCTIITLIMYLTLWSAIYENIVCIYAFRLN